MEGMKKVRWLIGDKTIPGVGLIKADTVSKPLPVGLADKLIGQNLAADIATPPSVGADTPASKPKQKRRGGK